MSGVRALGLVLADELGDVLVGVGVADRAGDLCGLHALPGSVKDRRLEAIRRVLVSVGRVSKGAARLVGVHLRWRLVLHYRGHETILPDRFVV